jgi:hypothetical protein
MKRIRVQGYKHTSEAINPDLEDRHWYIEDSIAKEKGVIRQPWSFLKGRQQCKAIYTTLLPNAKVSRWL